MKIMRSVFLLTVLVSMVSCTGGTNKKSSGQDEGFSFAFLTDIHVEYDKSADKGFQMAIESVNEMAPDFVITGGDLIADALGQTEERSEMLFDLYLEKQEGFTMPVYNTLGNHDEFGIYERSGVSKENPMYGDKMFEAKIGKRYFSFDHKGWRFYILDSVEETEERKYFGHVDSIQVDWLKEELSQTDTTMPLVIVTHIPFITAYAQITKGAMVANNRGLVVENSKEVLDVFSGHNLKMVLQGHLHIVEDIYINNIHFITGGAVCARWWNGPKDGMEEGYMLIQIRPDEGIDWKYIDYGWEAIAN